MGLQWKKQTVRENITPRGDGNATTWISLSEKIDIRENITPWGDGNINTALAWLFFLVNKREYNSERRRKLLTNVLQSSQLSSIIRENITPRGDGSNLKDILIKILLLWIF